MQYPAMGYARHMTVDPEAPCFYHCVSRCVRRAWLCGQDPASGRNFDHRRRWIEARLLALSESFAVSLYAWAVMSNHTHVVLRIDPVLPRQWSDAEVARRWACIARTLEAPTEQEVERRVLVLLQQPARLEELRRRLGSLSWFMRFLNECIAREANTEDECTGRFWEGRYRCQALLDDAAVLACMSYVDLNPIRAGFADELEDSEFTSVRRRLEALRDGRSRREEPLQELAGARTESRPAISLGGYLRLLVWTGGLARDPERHHAITSIPIPIEASGVSHRWWRGSAIAIERLFGSAVGLPLTLRNFAEATGRRWVRGVA
jgi:REP element-mobilizing transposase RayT